ncbi:MAG: MFS transporter [bacterium]
MNDVKKTLRDSAAMRWAMLVLISGMMFATYWFYDFFSPLKPLMIKELGITNADFGTIISATTWANAFGMIIIGGMFLDRYGIRKAAALFGLLTAVGAVIVALAAEGVLGSTSSGKMWWMIVGRLLFGSGIEISCVVITRTVVKWFKGYELALAMAINVGFGRVGSFMAINVSMGVAGASIAPAVNLAAGLVLGGFLMLLAYLMFDVKIDKQLQATAEEEEPFRLSDLLLLATNRSFIYIALLCVAFYSAVFPFIQYAPDLLINKFGFSATLPDLSGMGFMDKVKAYLTCGPKVASFIPLGTILFTPIFGAFVDKKGKAASIMILGGLLLIFAHLSLSVFSSVTLGYAGLFCLGIAFSLVPAAMWPSVAKIVPERRLGSAYASMFTIQNWGLMAFFYGIGKVLDMVNDEYGRSVVAGMNAMGDKLFPAGEELAVSAAVGVEAMLDPAWHAAQEAAGKLSGWNIPLEYKVPILTLVGLGALSILLAFLLKAADKKQGYGLELPSGAKVEAPAEDDAEPAAEDDK